MFSVEQFRMPVPLAIVSQTLSAVLEDAGVRPDIKYFD